jgi:hypothetical protein
MNKREAQLVSEIEALKGLYRTIAFSAGLPPETRPRAIAEALASVLDHSPEIRARIQSVHSFSASLLKPGVL